MEKYSSVMTMKFFYNNISYFDENLLIIENSFQKNEY